MKANGIQIGDWLYYRGQFNAFPFKVESITKKKVGYHAEPNEHRMYYLRLSECKPIPLVQEILERNGWKWNEYHTMLNLVVGTIHVGWGFYKDCLSISDHSHDGDCQISSLKCIYVHQLQHTLRLCGIEKIVEL